MQAPWLSGAETGESTQEPRSTLNIAVCVAAAGLLWFACAILAPAKNARLPPAEELVTTAWSPLPSAGSQESSEKVADTLVDNLINHALKRWTFNYTNLDETTLAKIHRGGFPAAHPQFSGLRSHLPVPHCPFATPVSQFPVPHSQFSMPCSQVAALGSSSAAPAAPIPTSDARGEAQWKNISIKTSAAESEGIARKRASLKRDLIKLCASFDRGFGATPRSRKDVDTIIEQLEAINPTPANANLGIGGPPYSPDEDPPPLKGIWRMVWTTALDVLSLGASPIALPGAIYQVIEPPIATNIIDFIPRAQASLPSTFPSSLIRAEVKTRASLRTDKENRVALSFEAVKLVPLEVLGQKPGFLPPLTFNLPQINLNDLPGVDPDRSPGYFDVWYLDEDMLIIKQGAPGGFFVLIKVPDSDP